MMAGGNTCTVGREQRGVRIQELDAHDCTSVAQTAGLEPVKWLCHTISTARHKVWLSSTDALWGVAYLPLS